MMEISFKWCTFYLYLLLFQLCNGSPIDPKSTETDSHAKLLTGVISLLLTVSCLVFIAACLCCQRRKQFEQFRNSPVTASSITDLDHGHVNPIANGEFTIFSPLSAHNNNVFHANETKAKTVEDPLTNAYDISSWFSPNEKDYPRAKLKYIKELGSGWFGKVVEGAVQDIHNKGQSWTSVVVRILEATSSQKEKILFLQNAAIYRIGNHPNILTLVGKSLETVPYLLLQEYCSQGDLKAYLRAHERNAEEFLSTELPLIWCHQLTSALKYIHEHDIVHPDLASRNCQLTPELVLKLGDYGLGPFKYPGDYYQGEPAVPVRWCAPESLICTQTTIQPKRVTPEANVWSLAVTMWEICECGEQPYWILSDDEVISQVLGAPAYRLGRPTYSVLYTDYIFRLMQLCWTSAESRPKVLQIHIMLTDLLQVHKNTTSSDTLDVEEFDRRWESCKPNTIIKTDHISNTLLTLEDDAKKSLSLSLNNLHGSLDNLNFSDHETSTNGKSKANHNLHRDDIFQRTTSSGSETEEENWRNKVERGAYTEKVRLKSRSVADLMVLTHVDYSESESETPFQSLEYRVNYKNVRLAGMDTANNLENTSLIFGSEGNLLSIEDTFKEELRKLQEERRDSLLFVPDTVSQSSFKNSEAASNLPPSRLIQELNNPVDIQPINQIFNIYNVTVDNFSPIHMNNKFSEILDVNCQLKPEWREVSKLTKINSELNDEIRELEKLNEIQNNHHVGDVDSQLNDELRRDKNQETELEELDLTFNQRLEREQLYPVPDVINVTFNRDLDPKLTQEFIQAERSNHNVDGLVNNFQPNLKVSSGLRITEANSPLIQKTQEASVALEVNPNLKISKEMDVNVDLIKYFVEAKDPNEATSINLRLNEKTETLTHEERELTTDLDHTPELSEQTTEMTKFMKSLDLNPKLGKSTNNELNTLENVLSFNHELENQTSNVEAINCLNFKLNEKSKECLKLNEELKVGEVREVDCKNALKSTVGSDNCDNLTFDVESGEKNSPISDEAICEAFNFNVEVSQTSTISSNLAKSGIEVESSQIKTNKADICNKTEEANDGVQSDSTTQSFEVIADKKSLEETIVTIIDDIITRSLQEASEKTYRTTPDKIQGSSDLSNLEMILSNEKLLKMEDEFPNDTDSREQIVHFDLSLTQDEVMPNSLTHSSLFTSTPFSKRSSDKFSGTKFDEGCVPDSKGLNYSLETWDNFLGSAMEYQNQHPDNIFDSFSSEPKSLLFIEGDDINDNCDKESTVVLYNNGDTENNITRNVDRTYNLGYDDKESRIQSNVDAFNFTYNKEKPDVLPDILSDVLGAYSGGVWDNCSPSMSKYPNQSGENMFDDYSSEPQSLIFIESEGIYKKCDNIDDVEKRKNVLYVYDDAKPGTSKEGMDTENLEDRTKETGNLTTDLSSTYTKHKNEVLDASPDDPNEGTFENEGGWYLHPQPTNDLSGEIQVQSPSTDTYIGFGIDDEIMSAIRNELLSKLPHAQGNNTERVKEEDEWDALEKNEVFLRYNVYNTPLSPIPEESLIEDGSPTNSPKPEREYEENDWSGRTDTDTLTQDTETVSAHTLESPVRGPLNRHTPSQDSCCSNDTLFNLEDLVCGITDLEKDADFALNLKDIEESEENTASKDILNEEESRNIVEKIESSDVKETGSKTEDVLSNFLSTERNYSSVVPLPSPEENPWKQLPASLLNYNQLTLTNSLTIQEEPNYSDCDTATKLKICDTEDSKTESLERDVEESEKQNVTFTKDHPDILKVPEELVFPVQNDEQDSFVEQDISDKENIQPVYENSNIKEEHSADKNEDHVKKEDHLYENSDVKTSEQLYENINSDIDPFDDYVNIVNMENNRNRLDDVSDKDHTYINTYEHIDKDDDDSIYGILTDIRFTGPADSQMMSTSFSENNDEQGWESGSDSRSSSSGEFIWREGEHEESLKALRAAPQDLSSITPLEGIVEDNFEESDLSSTSFSDDEESPEFVPSAWDKFATPSKSALRSPEKTLKKREEKKPKGVWFKKQKYHCIYEYPKEPESPVLPNQELWKQTDYKILSDNPTISNMSEEFFISSSAQPFQNHNLTSQFFPGSSWSFDNATPDSGMEDITPGSITDPNEFPTQLSSVPTLKQLASEIVNKRKSPVLSSTDVLGGLRHTRKLLKLDLPPSPSAFTSDKMFTIEPTEEPVIREKPAFTTFGKSRFLVQHVDTPPDETKGKNVSFEALPYKPLSPVLDKSVSDPKVEYKPLDIDDYSFTKTDIVERSLIKNEDEDKCKLKVEIVRGEASLLDSGDEDSGIESTSTLERKLSNPEL